VQPARIEELLRARTSGLSLAALAKELGVGTAKIRAQLTELQRAGQVRSEGSRRTSRWRIVTDEERIADRVAELEQAQASRARD
jgi:predicted ArsR family transcriptional regulator